MVSDDSSTSAMRHDADSPVVRLFSALAHPVRATIVHHLSEKPCDGATLVEVTGVSQPLVSHHLKALREAHLIEGVRDGRRTLFRLVDEHVAHIFLDAYHHTQEHSHDCHH